MRLGFILGFGLWVNTGLKIPLVLGLNPGLMLCLGGGLGLCLGLGLPGTPGLPCEEKAINKVPLGLKHPWTINDLTTDILN